MDYASQNGLKVFHSNLSEALPDVSSNIAVLTNASYEFIRLNVPEAIHLIRNPLDIVVSAYFSHLRTHSLTGWPQLKTQRRVLSEASAEDGIWATIAFLERDDFYNGAVGPLHALRHWNFNDDRYQTVRKEDAVLNLEVLSERLKLKFPKSIAPDPKNYSFEVFSGRSVGEVDNGSHYRSGRAGQWKDILPDAAVHYIRAHFAELLEKFYPEALI